MKPTQENLTTIESQKDFWDSLQTDILTANQNLSKEDFLAFHERNFMFSMFFRSTSQLELLAFRKFLNIKPNGYIILIEFPLQDNDHGTSPEFNELALHHKLKKSLNGTNHAIGPCINSRISILISDETIPDTKSFKTNSIALCRNILTSIQQEFGITADIGIGNIYNTSSVYSSFVDALNCIYYKSSDQVTHIDDLNKSEVLRYFDYNATEKHLLDAVRMHKLEAYDYFSLMMDWIRPLSDDTKRNKIIEILVLTTHSLRIDSENEMKTFNYTNYVKEFMELKGDELIEFAYQRFINITGYVKQHNSIDYSNRIVQATKEYLETHYAEDISLEDVAEQVNISPQYFSKLIKKTTGFNFTDWLSMLRVKKAKELLTNSNLTVKEVCFLVGYKDPNYFSRIFKKRIGITPSEYVKNK